MKRAYILIVNWNGWRDTLECLESVFRSDSSNFRVIVCDNNSQDGSLEYIKAWADNRLDTYVPCGSQLINLSWPPVEKPVAYLEYDRKDAENGGIPDNDAPLILISNGANLGFAGGNNVGLRYAIARNDFDYVWLLNNDTVVKPDALSSMIERMKEKPDAGICGSTLNLYNQPEKVQALGGGWYCKWIGLPWHLGRLKKSSDSIDLETVERRMNYVIGASLLVSNKFLEEIGLMCEEYFLFFEELDWAIRAKGLYSLAYAPKSVVYHKVGRSIGTSSNPAKKSFICDYFNVRNRLFFTSKYYPFSLPAIYIGLCFTLLLRIIFMQWDRVVMIAKTFFNYKNCLYDKVTIESR
jgi:GT2 family glycosyltransferase